MHKLLSTSMQKENNEYKESCHRLSEEIEYLRNVIAEKEIKIKEAKYEAAKSCEENELLRDALKNMEIKHKAVQTNTQKALEMLERKVSITGRAIRKESKLLLQLLEALERHTMGGHHAVCSHVFVGLIGNLREGIEGLKKYDEALNSLSVVEDAIELNSGLPTVENTLLEMCKGLEAENHKLVEEAKSRMEEFDKLRMDAEQSKLIPHYRLAIVRCVTHLLLLVLKNRPGSDPEIAHLSSH